MDANRCYQIIVFLAALSIGLFRPTSSKEEQRIHFEPGKLHKYKLHLQTESGKQQISLEADVAVTALWQTDGQQLRNYKLSGLTIAGHPSPALGSLLALYKDGLLEKVYAASDDVVGHVLRGVASMTQLRSVPLPQVERSFSGQCRCVYSVKDGRILKERSECKPSVPRAALSRSDPLLAVLREHSAQTEYKLTEDGLLQELHETESFAATIKLHEELQTSLLAKTSLKLVEQSSSKAAAKSLQEALDGAQESTLEVNLVSGKRPVAATDVPRFVRAHAKHLHPTAIVSESGVKSFVQLVELFRRVHGSVNDFTKMLKEKEIQEQMPFLIDAIIAANNEDAIRALQQVLPFNDENQQNLAERYMLGLAMVPHVGSTATEHVLSLLEKLKDLPVQLQQSVWLATGAMLHSQCTGGNCPEGLPTKLKEKVLHALAECQDNECRSLAVGALSNAALHGTTDILKPILANCSNPTLCNAALRTVAGSPDPVGSDTLNLLLAIYHQWNNRTIDYSVRGAAASILLREATSLSARQMRDLVLSFAERNQSELGFFLWKRAAMINSEPIRKAIAELRPESRFFNNYNLQAFGAKSDAFAYDMFSTDRLQCSYTSHQLMSQPGILKRSDFDVAMRKGSDEKSLLAFGIFADGLEHLVGTEAEAANLPPDTEPTAGLQMSLLGVTLRPVTFFKGTGGLMAAVWSAPSELTSAFQANILLQSHHEQFALGNGLLVEFKALGVVALDLSGLVEVSLWSRTSKSLIETSAAISMQGSMTASLSNELSLEKTFQWNAKSLIDFHSDTEFYNKPMKACMRMERPPFTITEIQRGSTTAHGKTRKVTSKRNIKINPASYRLSDKNSRMCTIMIP